MEQSLRRDFTLLCTQAEKPADLETVAILREFDIIDVPAFRVLYAPVEGQ